MERILAAIGRRKWVALLLLLAATGPLAWLAGGIGVDNGVDIWFVEDDPALLAYKDFQKTFGNDETAVIGVELPEGVFTADNLELVRAVSERLVGVEGVSRVISVTHVKTITPRGMALDVRPLATEPVTTAAQATAVRERWAADPLLKVGLVSEDEKTALIMAQMAAMENFDARRDDVITRVETALEETLGSAGKRYHVSGVGVLYNSLNRISQTEGAVFIGLSQLVIFVLLFVFFRRIGPVVVALAAVGIATVWLLGAYAGAGRSINMVTMVLPTLVLVIGVADSVHVMRHVSAADGLNGGGKGGIARVLGFIARPCLYTTLTTMAGFGALATSRMAVVRDLGLFGALGIGLAFLVTFVLAAMALGGRFARPRPSQDDRAQRAVQRGLVAVTRSVLARRDTILGLTGLAILVGVYGITLIEVDTNSLSFLPDEHPTRVATAEMQQRIGPFTPLEFTVSTEESEGLKEPARLKALAAWQAALEERVDVQTSMSIADVAGRLHGVLGGGAAEVPSDPAQLAQGLELYDADPDNDGAHLVTGGYRTARVTVAVPMLSARGFADLIAAAMASAKEHVPAELTVQPAGYLPLYVTMMDYIVESQVTSFAVAFLFVFLLVGVLFRSLAVAALSVLPNVFPVFAMLGFMGLWDIRLDVATVTITAIVLGIAVDDTIHYLFRYREELRRNPGDHAAAAENTARSAGPAILATTVILAAGFLVLTGAGVKSISYFGLLSSFALVVACVGDLVVLPAFLALLRPSLGTEK